MEPSAISPLLDPAINIFGSFINSEGLFHSIYWTAWPLKEMSRKKNTKEIKGRRKKWSTMKKRAKKEKKGNSQKEKRNGKSRKTKTKKGKKRKIKKKKKET